MASPLETDAMAEDLRQKQTQKKHKEKKKRQKQKREQWKRKNFPLLSSAGQWCAPPGIAINWKDPLMITGPDLYKTNTQPLMETTLAKQLERVERDETRRARRLKSSSNPQFRDHRPIRGQELIEQIQSIFELFSSKATNRTIEYLVRLNVKVLTALQAACEGNRRMAQSMVANLQMSAEETGPAAQNAIGFRSHMISLWQGSHEVSKSWIEVLALERQISQLALERLHLAIQTHHLVEMECARPLNFAEDMVLNALFEQSRSWRGEMMRLVLKVNDITGNRDFLRRHSYELWDIVDESVLNDYEQ